MARPRQDITYRVVPVGRVLTALQSAEQNARVGYLVFYVLGPTTPAIFWSAKRSRRLARKEQQRLFAASQVLGWVCWFNARIGSWYYEFSGQLIV